MNSEWSARYYSWKDMYPDNRFSALLPEEGHVFTPSEWALIASSDAELMWVGEKWNFGTESPFKALLSNRTLDWLTVGPAQTTHPASQARYKTYAEFWEREGATLDQISQENKLLAYSIETIRENSQIFGRYFGREDLSNPGYLGRDANVYFGAIRMFSTLVLSEGLFEDQQEVKSLFSQEELAKILPEMLVSKDIIDQEKFANSIELTDFPATEDNPFQNYLDLVENLQKD